MHRAHLFCAPLCVVKAAFQIVHQRQRGEQVSLRRFVGNVVVGEHTFDVFAQGLRERRKTFGVAHHIFYLAINAVTEAWQVGGFVNARFVLRKSGNGRQ